MKWLKENNHEELAKNIEQLLQKISHCDITPKILNEVQSFMLQVIDLVGTRNLISFHKNRSFNGVTLIQPGLEVLIESKKNQNSKNRLEVILREDHRQEDCVIYNEISLVFHIGNTTHWISQKITYTN
jgi:hypothetical protein